jgi:hypothetical protein
MNSSDLGYKNFYGRLFACSGGVLVAVTGIAKIWSAFGAASLLRSIDPVFGIRFRLLLLVVGVVEIVIAFACLSASGVRLPAILLAWVSTMFLVYRVGLWSVHWEHACPCLGQLTDALPMSARTVDALVKATLAYLLIGSYALLFWLGRAEQAGEAGSVAPARSE